MENHNVQIISGECITERDGYFYVISRLPHVRCCIPLELHYTDSTEAASESNITPMILQNSELLGSIAYIPVAC